LSPDLERELNEALANIPLDTLAEDNLATPVSQPLEADTHVRARVSRIHGDNIFFALGGRNEGVASLRQFKQPPSIGTEIEVVVRSPNEDDGLYELAIPGASIDVGSWEDLVEGAVVEARITGANTGGLECMVNNIRGFIPASQIGTFRVEDFAEYIGQKLLCVTTEVNRRRKNLVLSHRAVMEREKEEARRKFIEEIEPGQTREGVVRSIQDFGAFVDLGGVDGLIHISQLSWDRVNHPSEVLQEGQKVRVKVEKINRETGKIGLSYRDLLEHPWSNAEQRFPAGAVVRGQVSRIAKFGAFVKLAPGVEGLVHVSEMAHQHVRRVNDVVSEGQEIEVKVLSVDAAAQRMALSIKAALPEPAPEEVAPDEKGESERPDLSTQPTRPKRPLKGGVDRPSGGEKFGLKW
jgi:small subunit ribosomal protein S1